jgi:thiamine biosynthesis protein ThiI
LIQQILQIIENKINLNQIKTFKIETKRSNKNFQPNSVEINKTIASFLIQKYPHLKVDLKNPEKTIYLEIGNSHIYLYFEKNPGL